MYELSRETFTRVAFGWDNNTPVWTPDGTRLVFRSNRSGGDNLFWQPADGSQPAERLSTSPFEQRPGSWSPDGRTFVFAEQHPTSPRDVLMVPMAGDRKPVPVLNGPYNEWQPSISPDGRWLAYVSDESGRNEVYVQGYPTGGKWLVSTGGGIEPVWARNGRELFYRDGANVMVVAVASGATFSAKKPEALFADQFERNTDSANYDVSPDGQRFVMVQEDVATARPTHLNIIQNWFESLSSLAKTAN